MGNEAPVTGSSPLGATQLDTDGALWLGECVGGKLGEGLRISDGQTPPPGTDRLQVTHLVIQVLVGHCARQ